MVGLVALGWMKKSAGETGLDCNAMQGSGTNYGALHDQAWQTANRMGVRLPLFIQ